jgi:hypothetical protein
MVPTFTISEFRFFTREVETRLPFRYGIATMTRVPHLFVRVTLETGNQVCHGLAAESLAPKWFTKNPETPFEADLIEMGGVIRHATATAREIARQPIGYFDFWRELDATQTGWAGQNTIAPLLAGFGVSLCERAVLDALARARQVPLHHLVRNDALGLKPGQIHAELAGVKAHERLPRVPLSSIQVRHTVGLSDPLAPADIPASERTHDGLPRDLESCIHDYGLRYFKIKLGGRAAEDHARLADVFRLLDVATGGDWRATLDGNENYAGFGEFRDFWDGLRADPAFAPRLERVLLVEQPVHRDHALGDEAAATLLSWRDRPPIIIDESDSGCGSLPRALAIGYAGTSHKNCKGITKGLLNALLLASRPGGGILTGEDLSNLGPVALAQDLAMMGLLGIGHVERNGYHYFRGLSMWPSSWQETALENHPDLYHRHAGGFAAPRVENGRLRLETLHAAPFGVKPFLDPESLPPDANRSALSDALGQGLALPPG